MTISRRTFVASILATLLPRPTRAQLESTSRVFKNDDLRLHIELPTTDTRRGILLLPRINGLEPTMIDFARDFSARGMAAVIWDPYQGKDVYQQGTMHALMRSRQLQDEEALTNMQKAVDYSESELGIQRIGVIGWCLGGRYAFLLAGNDTRIRAMCAYHPSIYPEQAIKIDSRIVMANGPAKVTIQRSDYPGQTMDEFAAAAKIKCPVRLVRPGHDLMQPAEYARMLEILNNRSWPTLVENYPDAYHGFSYRLERRENADANAISWPLTLSFFENSLTYQQHL